MKRRLFLILMGILISIPAVLAQQHSDSTKKINTTQQKEALFPGGMEAMVLFIDQNIKLPKTKKGLKTTVLVSIQIDFKGNITDIEILSGVNKEIDQAIIDVIKKMPPWQPATINDIPIASQQVLGYNISY